jgi:NAD(P)-dependent dehydrogenase (short-subunit alcohol dehydrogenase family)
VFAGDINKESLQELERVAATEQLSIHPVGVDVCDPESVKKFIDETAGADARIDGLVCSAAVVMDSPLLDIDSVLWTRVLSVNLTGTFLVAQAAARVMVARRAGSIVTISSGNAYFPSGTTAHYAASKAGVVALTRAMSFELGKFGVRVNNIAPGATDTPLFRSRTPNADEYIAHWQRSPLGRMGHVSDHAEMIRFLLSSRSAWITGQSVMVNGGSFMR